MARFDLLVVGAGPAGLAAAAAAARHGASVCVLDQGAEAGGQVWRRDVRAAGSALPPALRRELERNPRVTLRGATRVVGVEAPRRLLVAGADDGAVQALDCGGLLLATGARELMLPFPGWTLPGVSGAGGLQALVKGGVDVAGQRVVVAGSGPLLWACADTVARRGGELVAIVEAVPARVLAAFAAGLWRHPAKLAQAAALRARQLGTRVITAGRIVRAFGDARVEGLELRRGGQRIELACDRVGYGLGLVANAELGMALGCRTVSDAFAELAIGVDERQRTSVDSIYAAGECTGSRGAELAAIEGRIAGLAFVDRYDADGAEARARRRWRAFSARVGRSFAVDREWALAAARDAVVCRCEDVDFGALQGYAGWEEAKRVTRCGMGPCQGRVCGTATRALLGWGPTRMRGPLMPTSLGALAGQRAHDDD